jgi:Flp pilus assembly protein TadG
MCGIGQREENMRLGNLALKKRPAATLVEANFVLSALLLLLLAIFEYGRFVMTRQLMDNAAREGARWAVANTYNGTTAQVQSVVNQKLGPGANQLFGYSQSSSISVYAADSSGNIIAGQSWNNVSFGANIAVVVTGTYKPILPNFLFMHSTIAVTSKAVMASEAN